MSQRLNYQTLHGCHLKIRRIRVQSSKAFLLLLVVLIAMRDCNLRLYRTCCAALSLSIPPPARRPRCHSGQISNRTFPATLSVDQHWLGQNSISQWDKKVADNLLNNFKIPPVFSNLKCFAVLGLSPVERGKRLMRQIRTCRGLVSICLSGKKE